MDSRITEIGLLGANGNPMTVGRVMELAKNMQECFNCDVSECEICKGFNPKEIHEVAISYLKHLHGGILPEDAIKEGVQEDAWSNR